jgi:hypothetical protein
LLQGWQDIEAMVILSLLCFIWAGHTLQGFCLLTCTFIPLFSSGSGRTSNEFQPCSKPCPLAVIQMRHPAKSYYYFFFLLFLSSCNLGLTKCEDIQEWKIDKYRIVKSNCLGVAGPRYYPITVYIGDSSKGGGASQVDSCIFTWQSDNESFLTLDVCNNTILKLKPNKVPLDTKFIDSVQLFSNASGKTQLLTTTQIERLAKDWNESKTRGYSDTPFDSAFSIFPSYQYKLTVFSKVGKRPFYGYNYLILDSSNWKFEMSKTGELGYFHNYWEK